MQKTAAAITCVLALAAVSVQAMQWARAYTDDGPLFYPGVTLTVKFWGASDIKVNTAKVTDGNSVQVTVNQYTFPPQGPGLESDYCDGCVLKPGVGQGNTISIAGKNGAVFYPPIKGLNNIAAFQYLTLVVSGSTATGYNATVISPNPTRWYQANFWTGTMAGAFHSESMWMLGQDGDTDVDLFVQIPHANQLRSYQPYQQVYMNVTVSDTKDGDDQDSMGYNNNGANVANPTYNTPYFVLAPFTYLVSITNNQQLMSSGSTLQFTGAALDTQSTYVCVFNNTRTGTVATSAPSNPTSTTTFGCTFPDQLSQVTLNGDQIRLTNITCVATQDNRNWGYLPVTSVTGAMPKWTYVYPLPPVPPGPDNGGTGLTGGQIFGIILAVFVGVGVIAYGGFYFYKKKVAGDGFYTAQQDTVDSNKPQQIQYNPSSYGSQAVDSSKAAGGFQAADNI